jgi:hypothetical protein
VLNDVLADTELLIYGKFRGNYCLYHILYLL